MNRVPAVIALCALLSACGGGEGQIGSVQDLASAVGCDVTVVDPTPVGVSQAGTCEFDGQEIALATFVDDESRDAWAGGVEGFGQSVELGPKWAISAEDPSVAQQAAAAVTN